MYQFKKKALIGGFELLTHGNRNHKNNLSLVSITDSLLWMSLYRVKRCRDECDVCRTHGDERLADRRQNIGPQRVQQQLVFGQNRQQQRTRVLRTQILQQLHKTGPTESRAPANQNTEHRRSSQSDRQQKNSPERQRRRHGLTEQQIIIRRELRTHTHS